MIRKLLVIVAVAVVAVGKFGVAPAAAHSRAGVISGTAVVSPGLWAPVGVACPGAPVCSIAGNSTWSIGTPGDPVYASGTVSGSCGLSIGGGGGTVLDHPDVVITLWIGVGGTIVLGLNAPGHTIAVAVVQARALDVSAIPLVIPCVTHAATNFTVVGAAAIR